MESSFRTVKVCPSCNKQDIQRRRNRLGYYCLSCKHVFSVPALKQVRDNRNNLAIPKLLRGREKYGIDQESV
jgi:ribosomal protein L37AE/L43A